MKITDYLKAIRECPDEEVYWISPFNKNSSKIHRLTAEYGLYDNYPIFLKADFEKVKNDLLEKRGFKADKITVEMDTETIKRIYLNYKEIKLQINFMNEFLPTWIFGGNLKKSLGALRATSKITDYNLTMTLHPDHSQKNFYPAISQLVCDIGEYAIKEKIPVFFVRSNGWNHAGDLSRIVYFPEEETTMCGGGI